MVVAVGVVAAEIGALAAAAITATSNEGQRGCIVEQSR